MVNGVTIHLIRHEKTQANVERRYIGRTDQPIVDAVPRVMTHDADVVYGSGLIRCEQTAKLYFPKAKYVENSGFNELDFGDFEMKTYEDLQYIQLYRDWIDAPEQVTPPNGESFLAFRKRVSQTITNIVTKPGTYTFVVHGGVIRVLLEQLAQSKIGFGDIHAAHHTEYTLAWETLEQVKEGARCISYSEAILTEKQHM